MKRFVVVQSPVGDLTLTEENGALTGLYFGRFSLEGEEGLTALLGEPPGSWRIFRGKAETV